MSECASRFCRKSSFSNQTSKRLSNQSKEPPASARADLPNHRRWLAPAVALLVSLGTLCNSTFAQEPTTVIAVGSGEYQATVLIEFADSAHYRFDVAFDGSITGLSAFDIIEAETALQTVRDDFGFGWFIDAISFEGHANGGYGGGENWWHYWIRDNEQSAWMSPGFGAVDRVLSDGNQDAWIYGRAGAPAPEPCTLLSILAAAACCRFRRKSMSPKSRGLQPARRCGTRWLQG